MQAIYDGLKELNVSDDRIHYEFFGPGVTLLKENPGHSNGLVDDLTHSAPVSVQFANSGKEATWGPAQGTLLDLAESVGLRPMYSCRSGTCGTCETKVASGSVSYIDTPPRGTKTRPCSYLLLVSERTRAALDIGDLGN